VDKEHKIKAVIQRDNQLYALYRQLHDGFGGVTKCAARVMKELIKIKEEQTR
jgi:hypothetical protein